jgi:peptidoglycan/xylan/chitin deacetylase (PgdA/CDA1 family)
MTQDNNRIQEAFDIPILAFHKVDPRWEWGATRVTPRQFDSVVHFLKAHGYETLTVAQAVDPEFPLPQKPVILTFDDAYQSVYDHAFPILKDAGFTATIFVITDYVGRENTWDVNLGWLKFPHLGWESIRELSRAGFEFGSHTHRHPDLTRVNAERIRSELLTSKQILEDRLGMPVPFVSFPFGRYNRDVIRISREAGYRAACAFWNSLPDDEEQFVFERKAYYLFDGLWNLRAKLGHNVFTRFEAAKLRVINYCSHGTSLVKPSR